VGATIPGNVNVIDPRVSLAPQNRIEGAHTGGVEDIDTQDNTLITCGWTYRSSFPLLLGLISCVDQQDTYWIRW